MTPERTCVRVLLVDDTPDLRLLLRVALDAHPGLEVIAEAGDGATGVELARQNRPDVVLLDLAMPMMDGLEALPRIRKASPDSRVVVLSGFEIGRMGAAALAGGADVYLQKGATIDQIIATIEQSLVATPALDEASATDTPDFEEPQEVNEIDELRALLATAAHELRSPATVLIGLAQTLNRRRDVLDEATTAQLLDAIVRQTRVLDRVTSDLLTSSQTERGAVAIDVQPLELAPVLDVIALTGSAEHPVLVECPAGVSVCADPVRLDQMLANLLSNANKYGLPPVQISATRSPSHATVRVVDAGPGVPEEFRSRLFHQYSRAHGLRASGTGLGLFVVKSLAAAQGGDAWYEPSRGGGSRFCFSVPLATGKEIAGGG